MTDNAYGLPESMLQPMTGLPNASGYLRLLSNLDEKKGLFGYTAFFIDVKDFGKMNKEYGRDRTDELVRLYVQFLNSFLEEDEILGHFGSDNFMALVRSERKGFFMVFLRHTPIIINDDGDEEVSFSATVGVWDVRDGASPDEVLDRPRMALNNAKYVSHVDVMVASDDMLKKSDGWHMTMDRFDDALANGEFVTYYQPKVDSRDGSLVGAEALARWLTDDGMVSPGVFIDPLEKTGRILDLDFRMLENACRDIARWREAGLSAVPISVNFSRKDLRDPDLAERIDRIITESGVGKSMIEVEVTETIDEGERGELVAFVKDLSDRGIATAVDDFGSGYSSLVTLRELPASTLKIDRSFVNTDHFSNRDESILRSIVRIATDLDMNTVFEGVERDDQLAFVNSIGCYVIQGFYYDRPLPAGEFEERLVSPYYGKGDTSGNVH